MRRVKPKVFIIGETHVSADGLQDYLEHVGAPGWIPTTEVEGEYLVEVMGRLCYRSFAPGLNPNVSRVRAHSTAYFGNILKERHGSVLEHASVSFIFADVSRVFTHELVRHRAGVAISQESLRFVRLEDLGQWLPTVIREDERAVEIFGDTFRHLERLQRELAAHFRLDEPGIPFTTKKTVTSALRRIAPIGLATSIGWTANLRTIRWVLEARTAPGAEEEIRLVFSEVGRMMMERYPRVFQDFTTEIVDGIAHYRAGHGKV